ncbi:MAG: FAD-binding oxidoreductase [Acidimicrobiia bacterium]|nr:FAD-binding oxidoreductase [Acidimicrobiia bacterium]
MSDYRERSLWLSEYPGDLDPRESLTGDTDVDVAIVGGGFTGLWTAYYLTERDPTLRIAVVERDICGFGASGRNGGWVVGELAAGVDAYAAHSSYDAAVRQARTLFGCVDEVGRVADHEGIDCGYAKGGVIRFARNQPQAERQRLEVARHRAHGFAEDEVALLTADEARAHGNATDVRGGIFFAPCAAIDPARLVRGLAGVVEGRGVRIVERTTATGLAPGRVYTNRGTVRADVVVRALEGYTRDLAGERRTLVPIYSLMIATEPLSEATLSEIGLARRPTFADDRYMVIYGQRTQDDRIAFGGRGVPYLFGSRIDPGPEQDHKAHELVRRTLTELFPALTDAAITHRWGGVLGAPRNWTPSVRFDRAAGLATAGGYVGEGVAAANMAGQTLADLITGADSDLVGLPWVGIESRSWEPEPLRWLGIRATRGLMGRADRGEFDTDRASTVGKWAYRLLR